MSRIPCVRMPGAVLALFFCLVAGLLCQGAKPLHALAPSHQEGAHEEALEAVRFASEEARARAHLEILVREKFMDMNYVIGEPRYDEKGMLVVRKRLHYAAGSVSLTFANAEPFDVNGSVEDVVSYFQDHPPDEIRYLILKRLVKFREEALPFLRTIEAYLDPIREPVARVREEAAVAIRMIKGGTVHNNGRRLNVAFATYETAPLLKKGGVADVAGTLPRVLGNKRGHRVGVFMPFWPSIHDELKNHPDLRLQYEDIEFRWEGRIVRVFSVTKDETPMYLLQSEPIFDPFGTVPVGDRDVAVESTDIYREEADKAYAVLTEGTARENHMHPLNAETAIFFSHAMLQAWKRIAERDGFEPDIVVTADWQSGLIPALLKESEDYREDPSFAGTRSVQTIHNLRYKGLLAASPDAPRDSPEGNLWRLMRLHPRAFQPPDQMGVEAWGGVSLMKAGIVFADATVAVSPFYAEEIQTAEYGEKLEGLLRTIGNLVGILNGVSRREWNPGISKDLHARYAPDPSAVDRQLGVHDVGEGKALNREWVRMKYKLDPRTGERVPIVTFVGRFVPQKGLDELLPVVEGLLSKGKAQFIFAGSGHEKYHDSLEELMRRYPGNIAYAGFVKEPQLKEILGGADMLAMPSRFEPGGLSDQQAMRFGVIPIVNAVGGLRDKIRDFATHGTMGNGYSVDLRGQEWEEAVRLLGEGMQRAIDDFYDEADWDLKVRRTLAASEQLAWDVSAKLYEDLFRKLLGEFPGRPAEYVEPAVLGAAA